MTKMFAHVDGCFPDEVSDRHTAPASQTEVLDDFLSEEYAREAGIEDRRQTGMMPGYGKT